MLPLIKKLNLLFKVLKGNRGSGFEKMIAEEQFNNLLSKEDAIDPGNNSRKRGEFKGNPMSNLSITEKFKLISILMKNMSELKKSFEGLDQKPRRNHIDDEELSKLENLSESLGVDSISYTELRRNDIFQNRKVLYRHVIVFSIKMDKDDIEKAPSYDSLKMIQETYARTGIVANKITTLLKEMGFGAQSGPGLGGLSIYPVLAERAGLGTFGRHGLIITPENGPTHRLGVVYTNIENLPSSKEKRKDHEWIKDFCDQCGKCIRKCPANAIYQKPKETEGDNISFIDNDRCVEYFAEHYGCSICIKECPFNLVEYEDIKESFL